MTPGERLKEWGIRRFGTVGALAAAIGIRPESLHMYFRGDRNIGFKMQERLRTVDCDIEWLMTGSSSTTIREDGAHYLPATGVPILGRVVASPEGKQYFEEAEDPLTVPYFPGNYFGLIIENDSLINAPDRDHSMELYPGDVCIFEASRQPRNGDIVAVQVKQSNNRLVKILKHAGKDEVELLSANKFRNYPAVTLRKSEIASWGVLLQS